jgi:uncharacterized OB-fold protein
MDATDTSTLAPKAPAIDLDSRFHWEGLRHEQVLLQCCSACARFRFPPMPTCPYCASPEFEVRQIAGTGTLYSWIVVHRAFAPEFASQVPYTLVTVTLDEGCRIVGRLEASAPAFEARVRPVFHHHPDWTELRFSTDQETAP